MHGYYLLSCRRREHSALDYARLILDIDGIILTQGKCIGHLGMLSGLRVDVGWLYLSEGDLRT